MLTNSSEQQWRLVPVEPTADMLYVGPPRDVHEAMLAAAPAPTEWIERVRQLLDEMNECVIVTDSRHIDRQRALWAHIVSVMPPKP